jgi:hypothetical protein
MFNKSVSNTNWDAQVVFLNWGTFLVHNIYPVLKWAEGVGELVRTFPTFALPKELEAGI